MEDRKAGQAPIEAADMSSARMATLRPEWIRPVTVLAVIMAFYHLFVLIFYPIEPWVFRSGHLTFALVLTFIIVPARRGWTGLASLSFDLFFMTLSLAAMVYIIFFHAEIIPRAGAVPTVWDVVFGTILIVALLEATRRLSGLPIVLLVLFFVVYGLAGSYFPGVFYGKSYDYERIISFCFSPNGIYGVPLNSSAVYVYLFILFGSFLRATGASHFFIQLALGLSGRYRGGPAKVAIIASSFFGTMAGSSTANVVVTGTFTIPMMIRTGFTRVNAGATEAVASTGGQIVPPIMGAGAFLMAEILGISYGKIVVAAILPAFLYYLAVFILTDLDAAKRGLRGLPSDQIPRMREVLKRDGHLLAPLVVLIYFLIYLDVSPYRAATWALLSNLIVSFLRVASRINWSKAIEAMVQTAGSVLEIATTTAAAGVIVGVLSMSGLGGRLASIVIDVSQGNLELALILTMVVSIILGMGMPSVAAYAVAASVAAPGLQEMGVPPLAAHMFVFYFASISAITPPVALASFAAASLANTSLWKVGGRAMVLGMAGYLVPFMFVHQPALLLVSDLIGEYTLTDLVLTLGFSALGFFAIAAAVTRWLWQPLALWQQIVFLVGGAALIKLGLVSDLVGVALFVAGSAPQVVRYVVSRRRDVSVSSEGQVAAETTRLSEP